MKKREYGNRVREVEYASFTPLVFATSGGMGKEATMFFKRLADTLSTKNNDHYSTTLAWIRCKLSFSLIRSAVTCIRGSRSAQHHIPSSTIGHRRTASPPVDFVYVIYFRCLPIQLYNIRIFWYTTPWVSSPSKPYRFLCIFGIAWGWRLWHIHIHPVCVPCYLSLLQNPLKYFFFFSGYLQRERRQQDIATHWEPSTVTTLNVTALIQASMCRAQ